MKTAALFLALSSAGVVFGLGIAVGRRSVPGPVEVTTTAREGGGDASAAPGSARDAGIRQRPGPAGASAGGSSAKVTALLAGFDAGKRVASQSARLVSELTPGTAREQALKQLIGNWASIDRDAAIAYTKTLPADEQRELHGEVVQALAGRDPEKALAYFAQGQQAAARWAANLPLDAARTAAVNRLAQSWVEEDPPGASEWIGTLPDGKARDAAVHRLVGEIASADPASAFAWASSVNDATERSNLLHTTFAAWRRLDPPAARRAIEAADWPEPEKAKWLEEVE